MVTKAKIRRKVMKSGTLPIENAGVAWTKQDAHRENVREFIGAMAAELAELAYASRLDALAVACDVVCEVAAGKVKSQGRHVECR